MRQVSENGPLLDWHWSREVTAAVKSRRSQARISQVALAGCAGIRVTVLSGLEGGSHRWRAAFAERTAAALGTDLAGLLAGDQS